MLMPKIKMTPGRRFAAAFWIGWAFHLASSIVANAIPLSEYHIMGIGIVCAFILIYIYAKNKILFEKEHTWMMLRTGGPKEEPKVTFPNRPVAPPPMPKVKQPGSK